MPVSINNKQQLRVQLFNRGQNSNDSPLTLKTGSAQLIYNAEINKVGDVIQRKGTTRIGDNPDTLISRWTFDDLTATDVKGANDGSVSAVTFVDGKFGKAAQFNDTTSAITVAADSTIDITTVGAFMVSAWIYVSTDGENSEGRIFDKDGTLGDGFFLAVNNESASTVKILFTVRYSTTDAVVQTSTTLSTGAWHKINAVSNTDKSLDIYIDGVLATYSTDTQGVGTVADDSLNDLYIGNNASGTRTFDGKIDEARFYDGSFTAAQIALDKIQGLTRYSVGTTVDRVYRMMNTSLQRLDDDFKGWTNINTSFTADLTTNFVQALDYLFILNGTDNVHVMDSSEAILTKIGADAQTIGSGLDDFSVGGTYNGATESVFEVEIDGTGTPDTFRWRVDGGSYTSTVNITGSAQTLQDGVTITFAATTGHTSGNEWTFTVYPDEGSENTHAPKATVGEYMSNNRLFLAGSLANSTRDFLWFSDALSPRVFNVSTNVIKVRSGGGGSITQIKQFRHDELIIYKEDSTFILFTTGATPLTDWKLEVINPTIGTKAGRTVVNLRNEQIFLDSNGDVRLLTRTEFDKFRNGVISDNIRDVLRTINYDSVANSVAWFFNEKYYLFIPTGANTQPNLGLVWNSTVSKITGDQNDGWSVIADGNWYPYCFCEFEFSDNEKALLYGDSRDISLVHRALNGNTDDGKAISMKLRGPLHTVDYVRDIIFGPLSIVADSEDSTELIIRASKNNITYQDVAYLTITSSGGVNLPVDLPFDLSGGTGFTSKILSCLKKLGRSKAISIEIEHIVYNKSVSIKEYTLWAKQIG